MANLDNTPPHPTPSHKKYPFLHLLLWSLLHAPFSSLSHFPYPSLGSLAPPPPKILLSLASSLFVMCHSLPLSLLHHSITPLPSFPHHTSHCPPPPPPPLTGEKCGWSVDGCKRVGRGTCHRSCAVWSSGNLSPEDLHCQTTPEYTTQRTDQCSVWLEMSGGPETPGSARKRHTQAIWERK